MSLPITAWICVKNGEPYIYQALKAVDFCDQKVLIDDGSTDQTVEIAEELGWEVYHYEGPNSMSRRRNYGIGHETPEGLKPVNIKNEWVLQIDHDEIFDENAETRLKYWLEHGNTSLDVYSIMLQNIYNSGPNFGKVQTEIPLPRLFRKGKVHWEFDIQNELIFEGDIGFIDTILRHYGYGTWEDHWQKQFDRLEMNEEKVRAQPNKLDNRVYLINCLSVLGERDVLNFERLVANASVALDSQKDAIKKDKLVQATVQRLLRHLFSSFMNNGKMWQFEALLKVVEEHINWIADVPYWKIESMMRRGDIDLKELDKEARKYIRLMKEYRQPSVMNVEIQSTADENRVIKAVYDVMLSAVCQVPDDYEHINDLCKMAEYWRKKSVINDMLHNIMAQGARTFNIEKLNHEELYEVASRAMLGNELDKQWAEKRINEVGV